MSRPTWMVVAVAVLALSRSVDAVATTEHYGKALSLLEVANSSCYFFKLEGVTQADPAVPGSPWFALSKSHVNAKEMYALLLSVRASGATLYRVVTSGAVACGEAEVLTLDL